MTDDDFTELRVDIELQHAGGWLSDADYAAALAELDDMLALRRYAHYFDGEKAMTDASPFVPRFTIADGPIELRSWISFVPLFTIADGPIELRSWICLNNGTGCKVQPLEETGEKR